MKKTVIIAIIALLGLCQEAKAQFYVGGSVSYHASFKDDRNQALTISPDIGYNFGKWNLGALVTAYIFGNQEESLSALRFGITPYAEYYLFTAGPVSMYVEGGVGLSYSTYYYTDLEPTTLFIFNPYIAPGIEISLTEHFSVLCQIGKLEWDSEVRDLGLYMSGESLSLGLYYNF